MSPIPFTRRGMIQAGAAGLALGGLGLVRSASARTPVGLQLSWLHSVQFAGSYIAQRNGWWREAGLEVTLLQGGGDVAVQQRTNGLCMR